MPATDIRLGVVGTGYVGLTTGACFAHMGHTVVCGDIDQRKVDLLNDGQIPIVEEGLEQIVNESRSSGRLSFVLGSRAAAEGADIVFLCVPTPQGEDGSADLSYIEQAAREIADVLKPGAVVVNKSTVPVGSTIAVEKVLQRDDVSVVSNPEFLREGTAVDDFLMPDRVVIGASNRAAAEKIAELYEGIDTPILITDPSSAETIKYASNAFLATKLSFTNAVAAVCEAVGADVSDVLLGMGYDDRIGQQFLRPGPGWGGSCFPKDTKALIRIAEDHGYDFDLLRGVVSVNDEQFGRVVDKIARMAGGSVEGKTIAVWGLTFKARTDDLRESPSIEIIKRLLDRGAIVKAFDPVTDHPVEGLDIEVVGDAYAATEGASVLAVLTEWEEFKFVDIDKVADLMAERRIVDGRNLLGRGAWQQRGFEYEGIGR